MGASTEDRVVVPLETTGGDKAAAAVDKLADSLARTAKMQDALSAAQAKSGDLSRSAAFRAEADALNAVEAAAAKAANGSVAFANATKAANTNAINFREKAGAAGAVISQMAVSFSELVPAAGGANTVFGTMFRTLSPLLGVIGTGGAGLAAGGLIAAVTGLGAAMSSAAKDAEELAKKEERGANALSLQLDARIKLRGEINTKRSAETSEKDLQQRVANGNATLDELKNELELHRQQTLEFIKQAKFRDGMSLDERKVAIENRAHLIEEKERQHAIIDDLKEKIRAKKEYNALEEQQKSDKTSLGHELDVLGSPKDAAKGKVFDQPSANLAASDANREAIRKIDRMIADEKQADIDALAESERLATEKHIQDVREAAETERSIRLETFQQDQTLYAQRDRLASQSAHTRTNAELQVANTITKLGADLLQKALTGQKIQLAAELKAIGAQEIAHGSMAVIQGIIRGISSYGWDPTAVGLVTSGGIEVGMGAALYGGGMLAGGGAGGGGGAAGGTTSQSAFGGSGTSPLRDNSSGSNPEPTVVNINFSSPFAPTAEDGKLIKQMLEMHDNVYGIRT